MSAPSRFLALRSPHAYVSRRRIRSDGLSAPGDLISRFGSSMSRPSRARTRDGHRRRARAIRRPRVVGSWRVHHHSDILVIFWMILKVIAWELRWIVPVHLAESHVQSSRRRIPGRSPVLASQRQVGQGRIGSRSAEWTRDRRHLKRQHEQMEIRAPSWSSKEKQHAIPSDWISITSGGWDGQNGPESTATRDRQHLQSASVAVDTGPRRAGRSAGRGWPSRTQLVRDDASRFKPIRRGDLVVALAAEDGARRRFDPADARRQPWAMSSETVPTSGARAGRG